MHQIRVHLAHSGHPIVGDKIYGEDEQCYLEFIETGWTEALRRRLLLPRHALHASTLTLTESGFRWKSPLADDIRSHISSTLVEATG
jgi:23S rRNA pseudouridine1911/1915/1917 synthase